MQPVNFLWLIIVCSVSTPSSFLSMQGISVTMNVYTHIGFDDAEEELERMEDLQNARKELEQTRGGEAGVAKDV